MSAKLKTLLSWSPIALVFNDFAYSLNRQNDDDESMSPSIAPKDVVLIDRLSFKLYKYQRGQIIYFIHPDDPKRTVFGRLLALEGDYVSTTTATASPPPPRGPSIERVPKGHCWVESDNPILGTNGKTVGEPVPLALCLGRVIGVCWPPNRAAATVDTSLPPGRVVALSSKSFSRQNQKSWLEKVFDDKYD